MIGLFASKSLCDGFETEAASHSCLEKYHSTSSLLATLSAAAAAVSSSSSSSSCNETNLIEMKSSNVSSSSIPSTSTVYSLNSQEEDEICREFNKSHRFTEHTDNDVSSLFSANQMNNEESSRMSFYHSIADTTLTATKIELKRDLDELIAKYTLSKPKQKSKKKTKSNLKNQKQATKQSNTDMTKELAMFTVKRSYITRYNETFLYAINDSFDYNEAIDSSDVDNDDDNVANEEVFPTAAGHLPLVNLYLENMDTLTSSNSRLYIHSKQTFVGSLRRNKQNKSIKLKTLLKKKNLTSLISCPNQFASFSSSSSFQMTAQSTRINKVKLTRNSLLKAQCKLHVKYNLYSKFKEIFEDSYVSQTERFSYRYSNKSIDKKRHVDANTLKTNKLFHKQLNLTSKSYEENSSPTVPLTDPPIVVTYSIDHNRVNNELNQTYDQMYLEFLISIQHREITPEDYEYLSRLDELVKKKTVNDNILKNLRSEQVNAELLAQLDQDQCGICLDVYALEQIIKYLPCGHRFHSECIDAWLRNQSTDCPLDKLPVDGSIPVVSNEDNDTTSQFSSLAEDDEDVLNALNDLIDAVEVKCILDRLVDDTVMLSQVANCVDFIVDCVRNETVLVS